MNKGKYRVCPRSIRIWTFLGALIFPILLNDADAQQVNFRQTQTSEETSIDQVHHGSPPPSVLTNPESKTLNTSEIGDFIFDIVAILDKAPTKDVRVTFEIINEPHLILLDRLTIDPNEITLNSQNWYSGEQVTISHQGNQPPVEGQLEIRIAPEGGTNTVFTIYFIQEYHLSVYADKNYVQEGESVNVELRISDPYPSDLNGIVWNMGIAGTPTRHFFNLPANQTSVQKTVVIPDPIMYPYTNPSSSGPLKISPITDHFLDHSL